MYLPHNIKITGSGENTNIWLDGTHMSEIETIKVETDGMDTLVTIAMYANVDIEQDGPTFMEIGGKRFRLQEVE